MAKISKKTFEPDMQLRVVPGQTKIAGMTSNQLKVWGGNRGCFPDENFVLPVGTELITIKHHNVQGSAQVQFRRKGKDELLNAFWLDIKSHTEIIK